MPRFGMGELLVILLIMLVLFGASRLPQLARSVGEAIREFKKQVASSEPKKEKRKESKPG